MNQLAQNWKEQAWAELRRAYYNDELSYHQVQAALEDIYSTKHREFGDLPATASIKVPSLLEDLDVPADITDSADLYIQAFDLYQRSVIGYDELKNLFPIRHDTAARIRAHGAALASAVGLAAVEAL